MNIILFGPPGIGKSTLIAGLKTQGMRAIDLEDVYPNRIRFELPNMLSCCFIGAADLNPKRTYRGAVKVLLNMSQVGYDKRRATRDALIPSKASQMQHRLETWLTGAKYDLILDVSGSINDTINQLISYFRRNCNAL